MILPAFEPRMLTSLILLLISGCSSMVVVDDGDSGVALADGIEPEATVLELPLPLDRVGDGPPALPDATDLTDAASLTVDASVGHPDSPAEFAAPEALVEPDLGLPELPCVPYTCAEAGANCGVADDGCGGTVDCGPCCSDSCTLVLEDPLQGSTVGQQQGG